MKKLQILGTGCAKCNALTEAVRRAAAEIGPDHEIEKVTDLRQIISFGVMTTPALVVDGKVVVAGKVPTHDEIKALIGAA